MISIPALLTAVSITASGALIQDGSMVQSYTRFNSMTECISALKINLEKAKATTHNIVITDEIAAKGRLKIENNFSESFKNYQALSCDLLEVEANGK